MAVITIVGSGMMGSALAFPARENGHEVHLVGTHLDREIIDTARKTNRHLKFTKDFPAGVKFYQIEELDEALKGADLVIGGVSSFGVDWFGEMVLPRVADGTPVLTVTKGLMDREDGSLEPYPYLWQRVLDSLGKNVPLCAVGGPCTSYELVAHDQTEVAFCGRDVSVLEYVKSLMQTDYYHISLSTDIMGIESAVALKNGYALGIALTIGLNQKAFEKIERGGILFTFSCSQVVTKDHFRNAVFTAAALAKRKVRILHQLHQPADHPINIYHPEGEYLKGLVLYVEQSKEVYSKQ